MQFHWVSILIEKQIDASGILEDESGSDSSLGDEDAKDDEQDAEEELDDDSNDDEDIPISDIESLASDDKADILPHQRLTINNTSALHKAYNSIALPYSTLPFSAHQSITTTSPVSIPDVNDDLTRELAFYKQCLDAANSGRGRGGEQEGGERGETAAGSEEVWETGASCEIAGEG